MSLHTESHFAGILIWRDGEDGREYLVIEYDGGKGQQIKFPGGTNNDHPGEEMLATLAREMTEETGLTPPENPLSIYEVEVTKHLKRFFLIPFEECGGTLRTVSKTDDGDKLSPPFWRTGKELLVDMREGGIFYSHRPALMAAQKFESE